MSSIHSFKNLHAWKKGHSLVLLIYEKTNSFPSSEQFGLTNQLRRASVSITSNIAEGFSRKGIKEKIQFYSMAHGSLSEVENQIQIAFDLKYIDTNSFEEINNLIDEVGKLLTSLSKSTSLRKTN